jgi:hypothetical protein
LTGSEAWRAGALSVLNAGHRDLGHSPLAVLRSGLEACPSVAVWGAEHFGLTRRALSPSLQGRRGRTDRSSGRHGGSTGLHLLVVRSGQ